MRRGEEPATHRRSSWVTRLALSSLAVTVLLVGVPGTAVADVRSAGKVRAPAYGAYVGVSTGDAPFAGRDLDSYRSRAGERPAIVMWYQPWANSGRNKFDTAACVRVWEQGAIPLITWEPWDPRGDPKHLSRPGLQPAYTLKKIAGGRYDPYIRTFARSAKAARGPIMIRLMHEMNGDWYPWGVRTNGNTAADYRAAWRHVVGIFKAEGATNVTWVWAPNAPSAPPTSDIFARYWPGASYVDWVGISGFNWGRSRRGFTWRSFGRIFDNCLYYLKRYRKPIMIAETACVPEGGDKAAWIQNAFATMRARPAIKAVIYYNRNDVGLLGKQRWRFDTSLASGHAYRRAVSTHYFKGSTPQTLRFWRAGLSDAEWSSFRGIRSLY